MTEESPDSLRTIRVSDPVSDLAVLDHDTPGIETVAGTIRDGTEITVLERLSTIGQGASLRMLGQRTRERPASGSLSPRQFVNLVFRHPLQESPQSGDDQSPRTASDRRRDRGPSDHVDRSTETDVGEARPDLTVDRDTSTASDSEGVPVRSGPERRVSDSPTEVPAPETTEQTQQAARQVARRASPAEWDSTQGKDGEVGPPERASREPGESAEPEARTSELPGLGALSIAGHRPMATGATDQGVEVGVAVRSRRPVITYRQERQPRTQDEGVQGPGHQQTVQQSRTDASQQTAPERPGGRQGQPEQVSSGPPASALSVRAIDPGSTTVSTPFQPRPLARSQSVDASVRMTPRRSIRQAEKPQSAVPQGEDDAPAGGDTGSRPSRTHPTDRSGVQQRAPVLNPQASPGLTHLSTAPSRQSLSPEQRQSLPAEGRQPLPVEGRQSLSPEQRRSLSPDQRHSIAPDQRQSGSPEQRQSLFPEGMQSPETRQSMSMESGRSGQARQSVPPRLTLQHATPPRMRRETPQAASSQVPRQREHHGDQREPGEAGGTSTEGVTQEPTPELTHWRPQAGGVQPETVASRRREGDYQSRHVERRKEPAPAQPRQQSAVPPEQPEPQPESQRLQEQPGEQQETPTRQQPAPPTEQPRPSLASRKQAEQPGQQPAPLTEQPRPGQTSREQAEQLRQEPAPLTEQPRRHGISMISPGRRPAPQRVTARQETVRGESGEPIPTPVAVTHLTGPTLQRAPAGDQARTLRGDTASEQQPQHGISPAGGTAPQQVTARQETVRGESGEPIPTPVAVTHLTGPTLQRAPAGDQARPPRGDTDSEQPTEADTVPARAVQEDSVTGARADSAANLSPPRRTAVEQPTTETAAGTSPPGPLETAPALTPVLWPFQPGGTDVTASRAVDAVPPEGGRQEEPRPSLRPIQAPRDQPNADFRESTLTDSGRVEEPGTPQADTPTPDPRAFGTPGVQRSGRPPAALPTASSQPTGTRAEVARTGQPTASQLPTLTVATRRDWRGSEEAGEGATGQRQERTAASRPGRERRPATATPGTVARQAAQVESHGQADAGARESAVGAGGAPRLSTLLAPGAASIPPQEGDSTQSARATEGIETGAPQSRPPRLQPREAPSLAEEQPELGILSGERASPTGEGTGGESLIPTRSTDRTATRRDSEMPSLTLQQSTSGPQQTETRQSSSTAREQSPEPRKEPQPAVETTPTESTSRQQQPGERDLTERVENAPRKSATSGQQSTTGTEEPAREGRETSTLYPDLTVKTLAPRIDVTRRETGRDITHRSETETGGSDQRGGEISTEQLTRGSELQNSPYQADIDRMAERLYREIERKRRRDRERRGL